jgi:hypothetical protein
MFYNNTALTSLPDLNTQNGTNFSYMFSGCTGLQGALQVNYNLSNATTISYMFYNCSKITSVSFATECSPTDMSNLFSNCAELISAPANLNTSNATSLSGLFYECKKIKNYPETLDLTNCTNMSNAFAYNALLTNDNIPNIINTSKLTNLSHTFFSCSELVVAPELDTANCTNFYNAFGSMYVSKLTTIPKLNLSKATNITYIFQKANNLKNITFEGTINISFKPNQSNTATFSKATIESMINALSDTATGKTLTLRTANKTSNFTDEEWEALIATKSNWTFSLV